MSKKPPFWEKIKKNYHSREEITKADVKHNTIKENDLDIKNSCSETTLPLPNSHSHLQNHREKEKRKKNYVCGVRENMKNKCSTPKTEKNSDNGSSEKTRLNLEYIDNLVCKIKELKNRVKCIENQCDYSSVINHSTPTYQHQRENKQIGDYDALSFRKWHNNQRDTKHNQGDNSYNFPEWIDKYKSPFQHKLPSFAKNIPDQKSIYTANEHTLQEAYYKVSKNQKNESNASLIMSLHSTSKDNFVKVNPHPDSKHFQAAAEDFIQQAEELKAKIGYILECCGFNHLSSISNASESIIPSEFNHSIKSSSKEITNGAISERDIKFLFGAVNRQYSEILSSLVAIERQINILNIQKVPRRSSIESMCVPTTTGNSNNKTVNKHSRSRRSNIAVLKNCVSEDRNKLSHHIPKKRSAEVKPSFLKTRKDSHTDKNLEPVVMVYEPILPECDVSTSIGTCKYCGQDLTKCTGCSEDLKVKPKKGASKHRKDEEKTEKYGFVVTYTPDISLDVPVNETPSISEASSKSRTKEKKKILPCLWF